MLDLYPCVGYGGEVVNVNEALANQTIDLSAIQFTHSAFGAEIHHRLYAAEDSSPSDSA